MKKRGIVLVLLTAIISGFSIFLNKFGVSGINPYIFTFAKNVLVATFILSIVLLSTQLKQIKKLTKKDWLNLSFVGLLGGSIPFLLFFKGLQLTTGASGAFVHKTMFIFVAILALTFLKEKLNKTIFLAAILLLVGNFLLLKLDTFAFTTGEVFILLATLFWAAEFTLSKHLLKKMSSNVVAFGRMFFGSLFILIFLLSTSQLSLITTVTLNQFSWILITSVFLLFYVLTWYGGLKHIKVTTAASILLLGSPITTLLSMLFLGSTVTVLQLVGVLSISIGIFLVVYFSEAISTAYPKWMKTKSPT
jgi:drug/metabolite transporter (DMT)-like permease